ncbi:uncharacterized protein PITG_14047 [Phytophthora infestans T30-4]|uniref:Uncharacterized protein n=1 Tax=Phytophthora infestans (strain T30-4) TaxID=403677 RepID=D0NNI2_PHYIT|nr:uncharacterized protein PITG_14047 [Phytophthora infestans T30-4]EEY62153.1 conserved hypothetical protein [Phytophthora infestans T30-4]|eukprot:XP_002899184.1 conserved hypothetical protein [Phytophthora infestans T30-4]
MTFSSPLIKNFHSRKFVTMPYVKVRSSTSQELRAPSHSEPFLAAYLHALLGQVKFDFPAGCLQFNGDDDQPNVGPFIGGGIKDDDVRAPYPDNYWFSFPGTCPLQGWGDKTDECRESTRKGLCSYGQGPDGVDCTFAYNVLGWVTIDDIVGITAIDNPDTGSTFANFTEWCMADSNNTEFAANADSGEMETGLPFWEDPLNSTANAARAEAAVAKLRTL